MDQWTVQLRGFLDLPHSAIGNIGGGKRKPTGIVDVAVIQSLVNGGEVDDIVADYGHLIVDECHHLSAPSFEKVARGAKVKYVLGLSATVTRRDGHHPIVFIQCGPVRFRASARAQARQRPFAHRALLRQTAFRLPDGIETERPPIQHVYAAIAEDEARNDMIFDDVPGALEGRRSPLVLTARKDHAERLASRLGRFARNVMLLRGGMGARERGEVMRRIEAIPDAEERVLIATGRYIGEGFDDARLDTLFLAMPVAWRGTLAQYLGRLHRLHPSKREVQARGAGLRLCRRVRTRAAAHDENAHPGLSQPRLFGRTARWRNRCVHIAETVAMTGCLSRPAWLCVVRYATPASCDGSGGRSLRGHHGPRAPLLRPGIAGTPIPKFGSNEKRSHLEPVSGRQDYFRTARGGSERSASGAVALCVPGGSRLPLAVVVRLLRQSGGLAVDRL